MASYSLLISVLLLGLTLSSCDGLSKFIRGRKFEQAASSDVKPPHGLKYPPEQYFDQRLDHFDESLTTTWKQVGTTRMPEDEDRAKAL